MKNNLQTSYQAPELNVWSVAAEQGFAASMDFSELTENQGGWSYDQ